MQQKHFPLLMWLGALCVGALLTACTAVTPVAPSAATPAPDATSAPQLANPASVNCAEQGGTLTIETRGDGGEFGVCSFEDNLQCEEWALFRGECPAGGIKVTGYATAAARYCAITGGEYQADESTTTASGEEDGTCTLPDGQSCNVWDYYNGTVTRPHRPAIPLPIALPLVPTTRRPVKRLTVNCLMRLSRA